MAGEKKNLRKCACCGREFVPRDNRNTYCTDPYCKSVARSENQKRYLERVANGQKTRKRKGPVSCNNTCPKDCRFRELLGGNTYYCNYGQVAHKEGKIDKPVRGGTVDECTMYEPGKHKRRTVQLPSKEGWNWF